MNFDRGMKRLLAVASTAGLVVALVMAADVSPENPDIFVKQYEVRQCLVDNKVFDATLETSTIRYYQESGNVLLRVAGNGFGTGVFAFDDAGKLRQYCEPEVSSFLAIAQETIELQKQPYFWQKITSTNTYFPLLVWAGMVSALWGCFFIIRWVARGFL